MFTSVVIVILSCSKDDKDDDSICDIISKSIPRDDFNVIETATYEIGEVELNGDCLSVSLWASGCSSEQFDINLYGVNDYQTQSFYPLQRDLKVEVLNGGLCEALIKITKTFDLTPLQIETQNETPLNIEGWDEQIIYTY
ncbi:hypothetical protein ICJ84_12700 [Aestuariibaculum suncheonense]|uniref:Uncharacterized protein n=1 Tax=Aestuariibaculum suncheonense TaxID=1028745 RepID=A0A8J6UCF9_9FLAO|nr:hypothetical protein [Aestuariibaculum suncheonense]